MAGVPYRVLPLGGGTHVTRAAAAESQSWPRATMLCKRQDAAMWTPSLSTSSRAKESNKLRPPVLGRMTSAGTQSGRCEPDQDEACTPSSPPSDRQPKTASLPAITSNTAQVESATRGMQVFAACYILQTPIGQ